MQPIISDITIYVVFSSNKEKCCYKSRQQNCEITVLYNSIIIFWLTRIKPVFLPASMVGYWFFLFGGHFFWYKVKLLPIAAKK